MTNPQLIEVMESDAKRRWQFIVWKAWTGQPLSLS